MSDYSILNILKQDSDCIRKSRQLCNIMYTDDLLKQMSCKRGINFSQSKSGIDSEALGAYFREQLCSAKNISYN